MSVKELLTRVRNRLSDPKAWCQGYYAYDAQGEKCSMTAHEAVRWCLRGAVYREDNSDAWMWILAQSQLHKALGELSVANLANWNDDPTRTHDEVLALLDKAIAEVE